MAHPGRVGEYHEQSPAPAPPRRPKVARIASARVASNFLMTANPPRRKNCILRFDSLGVANDGIDLARRRFEHRYGSESFPPNIRLSDTDRLETFSDGVFSITIALLVVDIVRPEYATGHLLEKLQAQWPNYIAFLASFFYVGIIWLNHRAVFSRVRYCNRSLHVANLSLLMTSALIPFPTAVLSMALQHGSLVDARIAAELYAAVGCLMCLSWLFVSTPSVKIHTFWRLMSI
jgi:uncharacterized membrane protein